MSQNRLLSAYAALLTAMFIWGSSFIVLKIAFREYDPFFVIFGRMFLGMLFFIPVLIKGIPKVLKEDRLLLIAMGVFEPCFYFIFEAKALTLTTASQAGMITSLMPLMVGFTAVFYLKEKLTPSMLAGFLLAIGEVVWLTLSGSGAEEAPNPALGNLMELAAMICATGYTVILKKMTSRYSHFFLTGIQTLMGSIFFLFFCFLPQSRIPLEWTVSGTLSVLYLGVIVTLGGYGLYNFGTSRLPASRSSAFINLIPIISLVLSIIVLKEHVGLYQYLASALILMGVIISQLNMKIEKKEILKTVSELGP